MTSTSRPASRSQRPWAARVVGLCAVVMLSGCSSNSAADDDETSRSGDGAEVTGCGLLPDSDVALLLGAGEVEAQDATTPLRSGGPILGCRWEGPDATGDALTIKVVPPLGEASPQDDVAEWSAACQSLAEVSLAGAVAAACGDGAFDRAGTELYARYDDGGMTMRLGLRRAEAAQPEDLTVLTDVARRLQQDATVADYERVVGSG